MSIKTRIDELAPARNRTVITATAPINWPNPADRAAVLSNLGISGGGGGGGGGCTILSGTSAPSNGSGIDGDFYIRTSTWQIYGPKAGGVWPDGVSIIGPAGAPGSNGSDGANGLGFSTSTDPNVAYIRSGGDDGAGAVGNPAAPFQTWQGAIDAGASIFDFGEGDFGDGTVILTAGAYAWSIRGRGKDKSIVGLLTIGGDASVNIDIDDCGGKSVSIQAITRVRPLEDGSSGFAMSLLNCYVLDGIDVQGSISPAGNGGTGGTVALRDSIVAAGVNVTGGDGSAGYTNGAGGTIQLYYSQCDGAEANPGNGAGSPGAGGYVLGVHSILASIQTQMNGTATGTAELTFSRVNSTVSANTLNKRATVINGVFYAD